MQHFGCNLTESKELKTEVSSADYVLCKRRAPMIIAPAVLNLKHQSVRVPDLENEQIELRACDETAPSVVMEHGTYADLRLSGAKIKYSALWAISDCVFSSADLPDCHVWNMVVQNFLWRTGNTVMIFYEKSLQDTNTSETIHKKSLTIRKYIKKWSCPLESTMACGINLLDQLAQIGYISAGFARRQIAWFKALNTISYNYPELSEKNGGGRTCYESDVEFRPVNHSDILPWRRGRRLPFTPIPNRQMNSRLYESMCKTIPATNTNKININFSLPWMQLNDVLLIVVFNTPHYDNIQYLEIMYRIAFPSILYCGPLPLDGTEFPWVSNYSLSFITYQNYHNHTAGAFGYECLIKAISMNYQIAGYLVIADDMFLLPHSLPKLDKNQVWFLPPSEVQIGDIKTLRMCRLGMCDFYPHWRWWEDYQKPTIDALKNLQKQHHSDVFYKCYKQLAIFNGAEFRPNGAYSDIYYIPSRLQQQVLELFQHFLNHKVFVEITVPTVITCLEGTESVEPLPGKQVWEASRRRDEPWTYFTNAHLIGKKYLHPTKWSYMYMNSESKELRNFFCNDVIPFLFDPYGRIEKEKLKKIM